MISKSAPTLMAAAEATPAAEPEGFNTPIESPLAPQTFD
jgi:hypothetical protein